MPKVHSSTNRNFSRSKWHFFLSGPRLLYLLISFSPPCSTLKAHPHIAHNAKPSPFRDFWMNLNLLRHESLNFKQYFLFFDGAGSELSAIFFAMFQVFWRYQFYLLRIGKFCFEVWSKKSENRKTFEGLSIEFLSIICHFKNFSLYI